MPMLSTLLRYRLVVGAPGKNHEPPRLEDLVIGLEDETYPPVTHLLGRRPGTRAVMRFDWQQIRSVDQRAHLIRLEDLSGYDEPEASWLEKAVLLKRDILDALMLDLNERAPVLANDLWLEENDGVMALKAVDIGFRAVLRRLSGGLLFDGERRRKQALKHNVLHDWRYVEFLRGDPAAARAGLRYHGLVGRLPPGEIAYLAGMLPYLYVAELLTILPDSTAADVLELIPPVTQVQVFQELEADKARRMLALMRPDIVADLIAHLEPEESYLWLESMSRMQLDRVVQLLRYPEDSAGGIMTNDMLAFAQESLVEEVLSQLVEQLRQPDFINFIQYVYVVDDLQSYRLQGFLSLRDLLVAARTDTLKAVMNPYTITLSPLEKAEVASRRVLESSLAALPVIDPNGKLVGVVTIDSALPGLVSRSRVREVLRLYS